MSIIIRTTVRILLRAHLSCQEQLQAHLLPARFELEPLTSYSSDCLMVRLKPVSESLFREWRDGMDMYMAAERVTYKARGCPKKFRRIWGNWRKYYGFDVTVIDD
ncbi:uncharacterized protein LOC144828898 [Lissotriton helveticus]